MKSKKLGVIVPYRNRRTHLQEFIPSISNYLNKQKIQHEIIVVEQSDDKAFNRGKLLNIGVQKALFLKCDYVALHDVDMLPIDVDYSYVNRPTHLATDFVSDEGEKRVIFDSYFGGVTLFPIVDYYKVNGYSNDYWGLGYEDMDLLLRLVTKGIRLRSVIEKPLKKSFATYNGINSYSFVTPHNNVLRKSTSNSFSMSVWFRVDDYPEYSADVDNNRCEYFIFGRPGYHTGMSITSEGRLKGVVWSKEKSPSVVSSKPIRKKEWHHGALIVELENLTISLFLNGQMVSQDTINSNLKDYLGKNFYVGVGNPTTSYWRSFFKGDISDIGLWNVALSSTEVSRIFDDGITNRSGKYNTSNVPVLHHNFDCGYDDTVFDMSGNGSHLSNKNVELGKKWNKKSKERYLPYRREGYYGYIGNVDELTELSEPNESHHPSVSTNKNIFNKKVINFEKNMDKDGLNNTRFRIVNRENYKDKHEIIEVVI